VLDELKGEMCFGTTVPDPDDRRRILYTFIGTQNPIETEGTYPLSEAQENRFMFKVIVPPLAHSYYADVLRRNQKPDDPRALQDAGQEVVEGLPMWVRTTCFFQRV